jgi:LysM repeat protein
MKVSKFFGCILSLHLSVIIILLIQPGCRSIQAPTHTFPQASAIKSSGDLVSEDLIANTGIRAGDGLDAAFNAGIESTDSDSSGLNEKDFGVDEVAPLEPIASESQTVEVVGASFEYYTVIKGDSLWSIAKRYNVSLDELYAANDLNMNSLLRIGQEIQVPVDGATADVLSVSPDSYQPTSLNQGTSSYTVQRGDTLSSIAKKYDSSVREIKAVNGKVSDLIRVGETLTVPEVGNEATSATSASIGSASVEPIITNNISPISGARTHTVVAGDFPSTIARQYGMTVEELLEINGVTDPRKLQIGKVLQVGGTNSPDIVSVSEAITVPVPETPVMKALTVQESGPVQIEILQSNPQIEGGVTEIEANNSLEGAIEVPVVRVAQ